MEKLLNKVVSEKAFEEIELLINRLEEAERLTRILQDKHNLKPKKGQRCLSSFWFLISMFLLIALIIKTTTT